MALKIALVWDVTSLRFLNRALWYKICNKNKQNAHFFINDLIQLYCLRHVSNNQVFILRKTCRCKNCMSSSSWGWTLGCAKHVEDNWIKSLMKKSVHFATTRRNVCKSVTSCSCKIHVAPFFNDGIYTYPCKVRYHTPCNLSSYQFSIKYYVIIIQFGSCLLPCRVKRQMAHNRNSTT